MLHYRIMSALSAGSSQNRSSEEVRWGTPNAMPALEVVQPHNHMPACAHHCAAEPQPQWSACTSPHSLQDSGLQGSRHTFQARIAGSNTTGSVATAEVHLVAAGACPPPSFTPTWHCARATNFDVLDCGGLGQACCSIQQKQADGSSKHASLMR